MVRNIRNAKKTSDFSPDSFYHCIGHNQIALGHSWRCLVNQKQAVILYHYPKGFFVTRRRAADRENKNFVASFEWFVFHKIKSARRVSSPRAIGV
jgi:hypothetical protein